LAQIAGLPYVEDGAGLVPHLIDAW
jgi:hypothetical protein